MSIIILFIFWIYEGQIENAFTESRKAFHSMMTINLQLSAMLNRNPKKRYDQNVLINFGFYTILFDVFILQVYVIFSSMVWKLTFLQF